MEVKTDGRATRKEPGSAGTVSKAPRSQAAARKEQILPHSPGKEQPADTWTLDFWSPELSQHSSHVSDSAGSPSLWRPWQGHPAASNPSSALKDTARHRPTSRLGTGTHARARAHTRTLSSPPFTLPRHFRNESSHTILKGLRIGPACSTC